MRINLRAAWAVGAGLLAWGMSAVRFDMLPLFQPEARVAIGIGVALLTLGILGSRAQRL